MGTPLSSFFGRFSHSVAFIGRLLSSQTNNAKSTATKLQAQERKIYSNQIVSVIRWLPTHMFGHLGLQGYQMSIDKNGNAVGNYTLLTRQKVKPIHNASANNFYPSEYALISTAIFAQTTDSLPVAIRGIAFCIHRQKNCIHFRACRSSRVWQLIGRPRTMDLRWRNPFVVSTTKNVRKQ